MVSLILRYQSVLVDYKTTRIKHKLNNIQRQYYSGYLRRDVITIAREKLDKQR